jgi:hypothetical protein
MINKVNHNPITEILRDASARPSQNREASVPSKADASLDVSYESLVNQVRQEPVDEAGIIERARQMVLSGELDKPENIRAAAANMVKFGI